MVGRQARIAGGTLAACLAASVALAAAERNGAVLVSLESIYGRTA
jgi:hypothetical protein